MSNRRKGCLESLWCERYLSSLGDSAQAGTSDLGNHTRLMPDIWCHSNSSPHARNGQHILPSPTNDSEWYIPNPHRAFPVDGYRSIVFSGDGTSSDWLVCKSLRLLETRLDTTGLLTIQYLIQDQAGTGKIWVRDGRNKKAEGYMHLWCPARNRDVQQYQPLVMQSWRIRKSSNSRGWLYTKKENVSSGG